MSTMSTTKIQVVPQTEYAARATYPACEALLGRLTGWKTCNAFPESMDDLRHCRLLVEELPEFRLQDMAQVSPAWSQLAEKWEEICDLMDLEAPGWREGLGKTPRTHEMLMACRTGE